jgi:hypothetical protein
LDVSTIEPRSERRETTWKIQWAEVVHRQVAELVDDQHALTREGPHLGSGVALQVRALQR